MIEHRLIERMIKLMKDELDRIDRYGRVDTDLLDDAVDFMRSYTDICHHGKEEKILFPALSKKPLSDELGMIMRDLIQEHIFARKTVDDIEFARERYLMGEKNAPASIISSLDVITRFYPQHINKEDKHFFIPCMGYLTDEEKNTILREFTDFDKRLIQYKYSAIINQYETEYKH